MPSVDNEFEMSRMVHPTATGRSIITSVFVRLTSVKFSLMMVKARKFGLAMSRRACLASVVNFN